MNKKELLRLGYRAAGRVISMVSKTDYRKVVLICNYGRGYLCNPKYIAEALNRLYPGKFDLVLLINRKNQEIPPYIRQVSYRSLAALRELATARVWIDNCRGPKYIPKRGDQVYIQTWHAFLGPKRCERDAENSLGDYAVMARRDGAITDLMFADNEHMERLFKNSFWYSGPVVRCGLPRNRPLLAMSECERKSLKITLGVDGGKRICLYAPTFRSDFTLDGYRFDFEGCLAALHERFGGEWMLAYRLHPNLAKLGRPNYLDRYLDLTDYVDAQEVVAAVDVVVSDYSSILEDFALTGKPGFMYAPDIEEYKRDRGFYYPLESRPFPLARSSEELLAAIASYDEDKASAARKVFFESVKLEDDGKGDEYMARIIEALSYEGRAVADVV